MVRKVDRTSVRSLGFDLQTLEAFSAVCRTGSMTAAAAELGLTQPAVSRAVNLLEERLETTLLQRDSRPLKPTTAGRRLFEMSEQIVGEALSLPSLVRSSSRKALTRLRLGVLDSLADPFVPQLFGGMREIASSLTVTTGFDDFLRESFLRHELDAVVSTSAYDELNGFEHFQIFRENYIVVAPAGKRAFTDEAGFRNFAAKIPLVRFGTASSMAKSVERHLRRIRVSIPESFACNTIESVVGLVASGLGWAILTPACVRKCLHLAGAMQVLQLPGPPFSRRVYLATRKSDLDPHSVRAAEICREVIRNSYVPDLVNLEAWMSQAIVVE
jgi:DNA-binding transcriptional LysR family regulator